MMAQPSLTLTAERSRAFAASVIAEPLPAAIINCLTSEIVAANAGGLSAFGLTRAVPLPYALDSAMPAIAVVRALANDGLQSPAQRPLVFWRNGRAVTLPCSIARTNVEVAAAGALATHVTIIFQSAADPPQLSLADGPPSPSVPSAETVAANDDLPPRIIRDDGETLKEIARRIREAQNAANAATTSAPTEIAATKASDTVQDEVAVSTPKSEMSLSSPTTTDQLSTLVQTNKGSEKPSYPIPFAAGDIAKLAHELKTPLTAIAAAAEIMRDERLGMMGNDKYLGYAADIHSSATHALAVIQDMLALPAADTDWKQDAIRGFDLTELARGTVSSLQPLADQRRLTLTLDVEPGLTPIRANATAIRQILLNLLTNALKFTPPEGEVRVVTGYLNDGAVFMVVRDTGYGIDEATLARIFNDGAEDLSMRAGGGRGIGLRLVRRLAAENGAEFEIDTAPGKGTIVMLAFAKDLAGSRP